MAAVAFARRLPRLVSTNAIALRHCSGESVTHALAIISLFLGAQQTLRVKQKIEEKQLAHLTRRLKKLH